MTDNIMYYYFKNIYFFIKYVLKCKIPLHNKMTDNIIEILLFQKKKFFYRNIYSNVVKYY